MILSVHVIHRVNSVSLTDVGGCREQTPRGAPWVSGFVGHFVQTWPDSEYSHTVQCLDYPMNLCVMMYTGRLRAKTINYTACGKKTTH